MMSIKKICFALVLCALSLPLLATAQEAKLKTFMIPLSDSVCRQKTVVYDKDADGIYDYVKNWRYDNSGICYRHFEGKLTKYDGMSLTDTSAAFKVASAYLKESNLRPSLVMHISKTLLSAYFDHIEIEFSKAGDGGSSEKVFRLIGHESGLWSVVKCSDDSLGNTAEVDAIQAVVKHFTPKDSAVYTPADLWQNYDDGQIVEGKMFEVKLGKYLAGITSKYEIYDKAMNLMVSCETASQANVSINTEALAGGTYYLKQYFTNGETATSRIVKY